jgi:hypothetical protein
MADNCCTFVQKFCSVSGDTVLAKLKLQNGVLTKSLFDMNGDAYLGSVISPICDNFYIDWVETISQLFFIPCENEVQTIRLNIYIEEDTFFGVQDESVIHLNINLLLNGLGLEFEIVDINTPGAVDILPNNDIKILSTVLSGNILNFDLVFQNEGCNSSISIEGGVSYFYNLSPGYGNGTHQGFLYNPVIIYSLPNILP